MRDLNDQEAFLRDNLDGKIARVSSGGVKVEGGIEQDVILKFVRFSGIQCLNRLEWNNAKPKDQILSVLHNSINEIGISYEQRDKLYAVLIPQLKDTIVQCGTISLYGITKITSTYNKSVVTDMEIRYADGDIVKLHNIRIDPYDSTQLQS